MDFQDILYEKKEGVAKITINRPDKLNAFTTKTMWEMLEAFEDAGDDANVGVIVLTGAGNRAFCVGGDQSTRELGGYERYGKRVAAEDIALKLHKIIRNVPKPVIAAVNGYAIGGGHVLHVLCDLTIASETASFGQAGPRVGSFDAGFGSAYLARLVGEKKAREIWYLCRRYTAQEALEMGLVNKVVPPDKLEEEVQTWCKEILEKSPTALKFLKYSINADSDNIAGITNMAMGAITLFYQTEESMEGHKAFFDKRPPNYSRFRK